jgi:hypothetical protein
LTENEDGEGIRDDNSYHRTGGGGKKWRFVNNLS